MNVWRVNLKTKAKKGVDPRKFCINNKIVGVGWGVAQKGPLCWNTYWNLGWQQHHQNGDKGWRFALQAIKEQMQCGDLCWTRDRKQNYWLGVIEGGWEYRDGQKYRDADIFNIRRCRWFRVGAVDVVPSRVSNSFSGRTIQPVADYTARLYSHWKYSELSNTAFEAPRRVDNQDKPDLLALISPDDCEDIVGIYLQKELGYSLIPSTCKRNMARFEFILKRVDGSAYVQVKQTKEPLNIEQFNDYDHADPCEWYVFQTNGRYAGVGGDHVHCLTPEAMRKFALCNRHLMSSRVQEFMDLLDVLKGLSEADPEDEEE